MPAAYGDAGLKRIKRGPGGRRYVGAKSPYVVQPNAPAYFEYATQQCASAHARALPSDIRCPPRPRAASSWSTQAREGANDCCGQPA